MKNNFDKIGITARTMPSRVLLLLRVLFITLISLNSISSEDAPSQNNNTHVTLHQLINCILSLRNHHLSFNLSNNFFNFLLLYLQVSVSVLPRIEFQLLQQDVGSATEISFPMTYISDFFAYQLEEVLTEQPSSNICELKQEGGEFESADSYNLFQDISSNIMQVNKSDDERNIYFLDDKLQLFSFRVTLPTESLSYLGMKKIDFIGLKRTLTRRRRNLEGNIDIFSSE